MFILVYNQWLSPSRAIFLYSCHWFPQPNYDSRWVNEFAFSSQFNIYTHWAYQSFSSTISDSFWGSNLTSDTNRQIMKPRLFGLLLLASTIAITFLFSCTLCAFLAFDPSWTTDFHPTWRSLTSVIPPFVFLVSSFCSKPSKAVTSLHLIALCNFFISLLYLWFICADFERSTNWHMICHKWSFQT